MFRMVPEGVFCLEIIGMGQWGGGRRESSSGDEQYSWRSRTVSVPANNDDVEV